MHNYFNTELRNMKRLLLLIDELINIDSIFYDKDYLFVTVSHTRNSCECPDCHSKNNYIHDYYTRSIKHGVFNNYKCIIKYRQRRYRCECGKRFNEDNSFVEKYNKISINTKKSIMTEAIYKSSFKDMASRLNVSSTTVLRVFNKNCKQYRRKLPEVLSIDEFKGNSGGYKYLVSLVDPVNKTIIDIVPCRHKDYLKEYFATFSVDERLNVKIVTMDMWQTYKDIVEEFFPNATIVADVFHFVRHVYWAFNNTRVRIMKKQKKRSKDYKYLKKYWKLLVKKSKDLSDEVYFDKRSKEWNSHQTIVDYCRNIHPEFNRAYELKESFYEIVDSIEYPDAYSKLTEWIIQARSSYIGEFRDASNTIENWQAEITNSFMINPDTLKKYTNGYIEGTNNYIKSLKRMSYGIKNFNTFRNKIMYQHTNSRHPVTT